jgi:hypothetical protein
VEYGIAIGILAVRIRSFGQHQSITFLLAETSGKRKRIFTPVDVPKEFEFTSSRIAIFVIVGHRLLM